MKESDLLSQGAQLAQTTVQEPKKQELSPSAQAAAEVAQQPIMAAQTQTGLDTTTLLITDNTMDESLSEDQHITTDELEKEAAQLVQ